jgi:hypothetical protein
MMKHKRIDMVGLVLGVAASALVACGFGSGSSGSPSPGTSASTSVAASNGSASSADPLVGTWTSAPFTLSDVEAALHGQIKNAPIRAMEAIPHGCLPKEGDTHVITLHFAAGQLVISDATDGGPSREGWTGSYAVQDPQTYAAGGETGPLYITVGYKVDGDRLITNLVAEAFPDHTPWSDAQDGPGASTLNGVVSKALADRICQAEIYETTPYTRTG